MRIRDWSSNVCSSDLGIKPDILTCANALTASYLPISAGMITDEVYRPIAQASAELTVLGHGYTYAAHPVCAAVALETLKIYEERDILSHEIGRASCRERVCQYV